MNAQEEIDARLRENLGDETLSQAESEAVWTRIEDGLDAPLEAVAEAKPARTGRRRFVLAGAAAFAAVALVALIALSPWSGSDGGGGSLNLARLDSASASEIFTVAAGSAGEQTSLVPGPGQVLYFRLTHTLDLDQIEATPSSGLEAVDIEEWIDHEGSGVRLDGFSGGSSSSDSELSPLRAEFDAARSKESSLTATDSWRSIFTLDGLYAMPDTPDEALAYVRRAVEGSIGRAANAGQSEVGIVGVDFLVLSSVPMMLMEAPLTTGQRAALYEVLADTPEWYRNAGSAQARVTNEGVSETRAGDEGILIRAQLKMNPIEAAMIASGNREVSFGVLLDPDTGSVLETQVSYGSSPEPAVSITSDALELRDRSDMPGA